MKEIEVLNHLREDSRKSVTDISKITKIPLTTVHDMICRMKKKMLIKRFFTILNYVRLGYGLRVIIAVNSKDKNSLKERLIASPNTNNLHRVTNGFMANMIFRDIEEYEDFKEDISEIGVSHFHEHFVLNEYKTEGSVIVRTPDEMA